MTTTIAIVGTDAIERLLDRLLPIEGQDGEDVAGVERGLYELDCAIDRLNEAIKKAAEMIPPEEEDEMETERERWRPEEGETYYFIDSIYGIPYQRVWRNGKMDRYRWRMHNVFQSIKDAYETMERVSEDE